MLNFLAPSAGGGKKDDGGVVPRPRIQKNYMVVIESQWLR